MTWRPQWKRYGPCEPCGSAAGTPCRAIGGATGRTRGEVISKPHAGRIMVKPTGRGRPTDREAMDRRLAVWQRRALLGDPVEDIAAELRVNRAALDRYITRARKRSDPRAVYHSSYAR